METEKILNYLSKEDLPPDLLLIAENEGLEPIKQICKYWEGFTLTLPKLNSIDSLMKRYIRKRYFCDHISSIFIAREIDRPVKYVNYIVRELEQKEMRD